MPLPVFTAPCTRHRKIADGTFEFSLKRPQGFSFKAGQFVMFQVPLADNPADVQGRAFSIASAPCEEELLFVAKIKAGGRAGQWISERLQEGDLVSFTGPLGNFTLAAPEKEERLLFLATTSGVAPLRSQIVEALASGDRRPMDLMFCVRQETELFWTESLATLAKDHVNLHVHVVVSRPSNGWQGNAGHVQDIAEKVLSDLSARSLYICGSPEMVKDVRAKALTEWKIPKERIHSEDYV